MVLARWVAAAALLTVFSLNTPSRADQSDPRLPELFEALLAAEDIQAAAAVEGEVWQIWLEAGSGDINRQVRAGIEAMNQGRIAAAIEVFGGVIRQAPQFAEGWNKRATAFYLADQLDASMADIRQTLALEPRHFGAISGMGLIFLRLSDERGALRAFQEVLKIHPQSPGAKAQVRLLSARLGEKGA